MLYESKLSREPFQGRAIPIFSKIPKKGSKKERQRLLSISTLMTPPSEKGRAQPHVQQLSACMGSFPFLLYVPPLKSKLCKRQTCLVMFVLFLEGRFIEGETLVLLLQGWFSASVCFNVNTKRKTNSLKKKKCSRLELTFPRDSNILLKTIIWPCQLWVILLDFFTVSSSPWKEKVAFQRDA